MKQYHKKWYQEKVKPIKEAYFKNKRCKWCGSTENLEIHHTDPSKKVGHKVWTWNESRRQEELAKCIILCRKCHQEHHKQKMIKHGISRYNAGCRCEICLEARREKHRRAKARKKS